MKACEDKCPSPMTVHTAMSIYDVTVKGRVWRFKYDDFGPLWLRKDGKPRVHQDPPDDVWDAFMAWLYDQPDR